MVGHEDLLSGGTAETQYLDSSIFRTLGPITFNACTVPEIGSSLMLEITFKVEPPISSHGGPANSPNLRNESRCRWSFEHGY
jgi:hypothetical protein